MIAWLARIATAGCAVTGHEAEDRAHAPLVGAGRVESLAFVGEELVESIVRLDEVRVGRVDSGFLALRARLTGAGCPGDEVWPPGASVSIVATPDADGVVWPSPCVADVFSGPLPADAGVRAAPGRWAGAEAPAVLAPAPFPTPGPSRARVVRLGSATLGAPVRGGGEAAELDGPVWRRADEAVGLLVDHADLSLAAVVPVEDLAQVPLRPVSFRPGVRLFPGAPIENVGGAERYARDGVQVVGAVGPDVGPVWTPLDEPPLQPDASPLRDTVLLDAPGGRPLAHLSAGGAFALRTTGRRRDGYVEVTVAAPWLRAVGWVAQADVGPLALWGHGRGSGSLRPGTWIGLAADLVLTTPDGAVAFARARRDTEVRLLATDGALAFVALPTPWGAVVARGLCAAPPGPGTPCAPP